MESYRDIEIYDLQSYFLLTGRTKSSSMYKLLKIKKLPQTLELQEVKQTFTRPQLDSYLQECIKEGFPTLLIKAEALLGVTQFTQGYYLYFVTKKQKSAKIRGKSLYRIIATKLFKIFPEKKTKAEKRYKDIFNSLDIDLGFYFSYSYDLTFTLQENIYTSFKSKKNSKNLNFKEKKHNTFHSFSLPKTSAEFEIKEIYPWKTQFVWNHDMVVNLYSKLIDKSWLICTIHGFIGYRYISLLGKRYDLVVISRRSRFFAGTRYLKRGLNEEGQVANDVETEQILVDKLPYGKMSSFTQHRGSVPLFWCQDHNSMLPSPPITLNQNDFLHDATLLHFSDMFQRYGAPIILINLLRVNSKNKENQLAQEYKNTVDQLNEQIPEKFKIQYNSFDIKNEIKKSKKTYEEKFYNDFKEMIPKIGVFLLNGKAEGIEIKLQAGVVRTNCVDCIDRTNEGQLLISHLALEFQLKELGICESLSKKCEIVQVLTRMFEEMGDAIALQYSGSIAHKATNSKEKSKQSKIIVATKRHLANLIKDSKKQQAINLFLGIYKANQYPIPLWDIPDDFRLHNRQIVYNRNRGKWWKYEFNKYCRRNGLKFMKKPHGNSTKKEKYPIQVLKFDYDKFLLSSQNTKKLTFFDKKQMINSDLIEVSIQEDLNISLGIKEDNKKEYIKKDKEEDIWGVIKDDIELFKAYTCLDQMIKIDDFFMDVENEVIKTDIKAIGDEGFLPYLDLKIDPEELLKEVSNDDYIFDS